MQGKGKTEQTNIAEQQYTDVLKLNRVYEGYTKGESPSQDGRTSHASSSQNPRKMLRKQSPKVTTRSEHKRRSFEGRIGQGRHRKRRRMIMHGTISSICRTKVCVPFKTKLENDSDIDQSVVQRSLHAAGT